MTLFNVAPHLCLVETALRCKLDSYYRGKEYCTLHELRSILQKDELHLRCLTLDYGISSSFLEIVSSIAHHPSLQQLVLVHASFYGEQAAGFDAVVGLAIERRLSTLCLMNAIGLGSVHIPALIRLLNDGKLSTLRIGRDGHSYSNILLEPNPGVLAMFCGAISNATLLCLDLGGIEVQTDACVALVAAVTGHPTLQQLRLWQWVENDAHKSAVAVALGQLVSVNAPAGVVDQCRLARDCVGQTDMCSSS